MSPFHKELSHTVRFFCLEKSWGRDVMMALQSPKWHWDWHQTSIIYCFFQYKKQEILPKAAKVQCKTKWKVGVLHRCQAVRACGHWHFKQVQKYLAEFEVHWVIKHKTSSWIIRSTLWGYHCVLGLFCACLDTVSNGILSYSIFVLLYYRVRIHVKHTHKTKYILFIRFAVIRK